MNPEVNEKKRTFKKQNVGAFLVKAVADKRVIREL